MFQTTPHIQKNIRLPMSFVRFTNLPASANSAQTAKVDFSSPVGDLRNAAWGYIFPNNWGGKFFLAMLP
jgi:hypothetical protein